MHFKLVLEDVSGDDLRKLADIFGGTRQVVVAAVAEENKTAATSTLQVPATPVAQTSPAAPVVPVVVPQQPQATAAVKDSTGLPYDDRIHSSAKGFNKDGSWKKKRGVDQLIVDTVEAELRGVRVDIPAHQPALTVPQQPQVPQFPNLNTTPPGFPATKAAPIAPIAAVRDFNSVLSRIQAAFREKRMTPANIQGLNINLGVNSITDITGNEQLVNAAHSLLDQYEVK